MHDDPRGLNPPPPWICLGHDLTWHDLVKNVSYFEKYSQSEPKLP